MTTETIDDNKVIVSKADVTDAMLRFESMLAKEPDAKFGDDCAPLLHFFGDCLYIREILMTKGMIYTSKIHKTTHPYFVMKGSASVITDTGIVHIEAPYFGMTQAGTKRVLYIHEDCVWFTVHATEETDLVAIEDQIIAKDYAELQEHLDKEKLLWHGQQ